MKKPTKSKDAADKMVKNIRRKTRQTYSAEEKVRIILGGLSGEESTTNLGQTRTPLKGTSMSVSVYIRDSFFLDSAPAPTIILIMTALFIAAFIRRQIITRRTSMQRV